MSRRLANKAARAARMSRKGISVPFHPAGDFPASSPYPDLNVPESEREVIVEELPNGMVRTTYVDTKESRAKGRKAAVTREAAKEPEEPAKVPAPAPEVATPQEPPEQSPFANYSMPGHPKKGIVFGAKL